jgi:hypothetical protein
MDGDDFSVLEDLQNKSSFSEEEDDEYEDRTSHTEPSPGHLNGELVHLQHGTRNAAESQTAYSALDFENVRERFSDDNVTPKRIAWCEKRFNQK